MKAFYGMTETQGNATLHCHLLLWLHGTPNTTIQYETQTKIEKENFNNELELYANSIVTNNLPSRPDNVSCSRCKTECAFDPLPVNPKYRQKMYTIKKKKKIVSKENRSLRNANIVANVYNI